MATELYHTDKRHINTHSDSEVLVNLFANELSNTAERIVSPECIFNAAKAFNQRIRGAYATVGLIVGLGLFGMRDPHGLRR